MSRKFFIIFILLFSYFFFAPQTLAVSNDACDDNSPGGKPVLISAVPKGNSVTLTWSEAQDPVTHYLVAYGRSETEIEYGNPNVGGKGTTTYTVGGLAKGVKYYFKVRPVNGCRPGDFSNKLSATPGLAIGKNIASKPNLSIYKPVLGINTSPTPALAYLGPTNAYCRPSKSFNALKLFSNDSNKYNFSILAIFSNIL